MDIRVAKREEYPACAECVAATEYYQEVCFSEMGGTVVLAMHEGIIIGVVWFAVSGRWAYLDYLTVRPAWQNGKVAGALLLKAQELMREANVNKVSFAMHGLNPHTLKLASHFSALVDGPYILGSVTLE